MRTHTRQTLLIIVLILILIFKFCEDSKNEINEIDKKPDYNYKTDTIYVDRPFVPKEHIGEKTKPKTKTFYENEKPRFKVSCKDSIITIRDTIDTSQVFYLSPDFLKLYPSSPKLLNLELKKDSLSLTLMDSMAKVFTDYYPIDLLYFNYRINETGEMKREDLNYKPKKYVSKGLFVGAEYRVNKNIPLVFINYDYPIKSLESSIGLATFYENMPKMEIFIRLRKRIK